MKTFRKWHVPEAERWQADLGGVGPLPVHPLNILSMFPPWPQNHSNVFLPPPPPSDPGSARRSVCRKVPEAPPLPREGPRPAWRSGRRSSHQQPILPQLLLALAWPPGPRLLLVRSEMEHPLHEEGLPSPYHSFWGRFPFSHSF